VTTVDLEKLSAAELQDLADVRRAAERRAAEQRIAVALDVMDRPAIGHYRRRAKTGQP
jgi:hypothetical protein